MSSLVRTGISLDSELLARFDRTIAKKGYGSRSEAIRDLVRELAVATDVAQNEPVVATLIPDDLSASSMRATLTG